MALAAPVAMDVGPCYLPGCPNSTMTVDQSVPGKTTISYSNGGVKGTSTFSSNSTLGTGVGGAIVSPGGSNTWGDVDSCDDMVGECV